MKNPRHPQETYKHSDTGSTWTVPSIPTIAIGARQSLTSPMIIPTYYRSVFKAVEITGQNYKDKSKISSLAAKTETVTDKIPAKMKKQDIWHKPLSFVSVCVGPSALPALPCADVSEDPGTPSFLSSALKGIITNTSSSSPILEKGLRVAVTSVGLE